MSDQVRITGKIEVEYFAFVGQEVYEAWEAGDRRAGDTIADALAAQARAALDDVEPADGKLIEAWLVEDDGYLGTEIVRLKKF